MGIKITYTPLPLFDTLGSTAELIEQNIPLPVTIPKAFAKEFQLALLFLYSYRGSEATFNAYRREIERFLQWAWFISKKSIQELKRESLKI